LWPTPTVKGNYNKAGLSAKSGNGLATAVLTSSAAVSPVRTSASLEKGQVLPASAAAYGRSLSELLARLGPDGSSLKMSARCFQEAINTNFQMTDAYAAGLIDGEGCISIAHRNERIFYPRVDVGMGLKGLPALEALKTTYGGSIQMTRQRSEKWEEARAWRLFGRPLEAFLIAIFPHLLLKRPQAEHALAMQRMIDSLPRRPNGSASWTAEATKNAKVIRRLMTELNRKGPQHSQSTGWFAKLVGETWITPQRALFSPHGWEEFSGTWPRSGILQNFTADQLPPLVRLTDEIGSGLSPTPRSEDSEQTGGHLGKPDTLTAAARMWPTSTAVTDTGGAALCKWGGARSREKLRTMVSSEEFNGSLNPTWVEWLMGYPTGWTALEPSATPSSRRSRKSSGEQS
jgi:hypothetical protein